MKHILLLCAVLLISTASVSEARAGDPGIDLIIELEHAQASICPRVSRVRVCNTHFATLLAHARDIANSLFSARLAQQKGQPVIARNRLHEMVEFKRKLRSSVALMYWHYRSVGI